MRSVDGGAAGRRTTAVAAAFSTLLFGVMSVMRRRSWRGIDEAPVETFGDAARPTVELRETRVDPVAAANLRAGNARAGVARRLP